MGTYGSDLELEKEFLSKSQRVQTISFDYNHI